MLSVDSPSGMLMVALQQAVASHVSWYTSWLTRKLIIGLWLDIDLDHMMADQIWICRHTGHAAET